MFKNNKLKKLLAFSIISGGVLFCGTNAYAVKAPSNYSGGNCTSPKTLRRPVFSSSKLLKDIKSGKTVEHAKYTVITGSGLLVDMYEDMGGTVKGFSPSDLVHLREVWKDLYD